MTPGLQRSPRSSGREAPPQILLPVLHLLQMISPPTPLLHGVKAVGVVPSLLGCFSGHSALAKAPVFAAEPNTEILRLSVTVSGRRGLPRRLSWLPGTVRTVSRLCAVWRLRDEGIHCLRLAETFLSNLCNPTGGHHLVQRGTGVFLTRVFISFLFLHRPADAFRTRWCSTSLMAALMMPS